MRILYLDCSMGAAGDMLTAALLELLPDPGAFISELNSLGIPGVSVSAEKAVKCGITGTHISVKVNGVEEGDHHHHHDHEHHDHDHDHEHHHHDHDHHHHEHKHDHHDHDHEHEHEHEHTHAHHHSGMHDIEHIVSSLSIPEKVKKDIMAVYTLIAEAEGQVHGKEISDIHFHEVGTMDAIADVTAVCMLIDRLSPDEIVSSPVHVGSGTVKCAHGILPVPAPATAHILRGVPTYGGAIESELCTPTGAALLRHFANRFDRMPTMKTSAIGYGMGKKDFERANCLRAMLGEGEDRTDLVSELSCNVDDMTAEEISFAMERLFEAGALEVYTVPIGMKKSRPGTLIRVMCVEENREKILETIFKHTTTIGVRETLTKRYVMDRNIETLSTPFGDVHCKISNGYGTTRQKLEFEDVARVAREKNISLAQARELIHENSAK